MGPLRTVSKQQTCMLRNILWWRVPCEFERLLQPEADRPCQHMPHQTPTPHTLHV